MTKNLTLLNLDISARNRLLDRLDWCITESERLIATSEAATRAGFNLIDLEGVRVRLAQLRMGRVLLTMTRTEREEGREGYTSIKSDPDRPHRKPLETAQINHPEMRASVLETDVPYDANTYKRRLKR